LKTATKKRTGVKKNEGILKMKLEDKAPRATLQSLLAVRDRLGGEKT